MITHAYENDKDRLFEMVKEDDLDCMHDLLIELKQKNESARKRLGKFAGFLDDPVYDLNKLYKNNQSLVILACEYGNSKMIKLLVDHGVLLD